MAIKHENYQLFNHLQNTIMKNDHAYDVNDSLEYTTFSSQKPWDRNNQQSHGSERQYSVITIWALAF